MLLRHIHLICETMEEKIKCCRHVTATACQHKTTDLRIPAAGSLKGQSEHLMQAHTDTETHLHI